MTGLTSGTRMTDDACSTLLPSSSPALPRTCSTCSTDSTTNGCEPLSTLVMFFFIPTKEGYTICPRSSCPFYIRTDYIKWVTTLWTVSILCIRWFFLQTPNLWNIFFLQRAQKDAFNAFYSIYDVIFSLFPLYMFPGLSLIISLFPTQYNIILHYIQQSHREHLYCSINQNRYLCQWYGH